MPNMFAVTYEIVTPESAEHGDADERGFMTPGGWRTPIEQVEPGENYTMGLREALQLCCPCHDSGDWFDAEPYTKDYRTGEEISTSLHPPRNITASSYARLRRLLGVR